MTSWFWQGKGKIIHSLKIFKSGLHNKDIFFKEKSLYQNPFPAKEGSFSIPVPLLAYHIRGNQGRRIATSLEKH
jgi:hypothetical protein